MKLLTLFWEFFKISLFVIGGGYAIIAVADETFAKRGWIREGELIEHLPVFQTIPGLLATHSAVFVGRKTAGIPGAVVSVLGVALPSIVIFTLVAAGYRSIPLDNPYLGSAFVGLRSALTGIILASIIRSWKRNLPDGFAYAVMLLALAALLFFLSPVWAVLLVAMAMGLAAEFGNRPEEKRFESNWLALLLFLKYGALCFGGGFVLVPMYIQDFVGEAAAFLQIAHEEFSNVIALSQMTPGPIGVNGATFFGYRLCGVPGALLASAALLLPGSALCFLALSSLERFKTSRIVRGLMRGIRPGSVALMLVALWAFAGLSLFDSEDNVHWWAIVFIAAATVVIMKKKLNMILMIVLCTLAATAVRAADASPSDYPDADTVVVEDVEDVTYEADGTSVTVEDERVAILTEKGRRAKSSLSIGYNARYEKAEFLSVSITDTNGVERAVDVSGTLKDATDNGSTSSNIYDPLDRTLSCAVPGLAVGDTLRVRTRRETFSPRVKDSFSDLYVLEWTSPIVRAEVHVSAPAERPLAKAEIRHPLGNVSASVTTNDAGRILYAWCCTNSPQAFPEPDMPPLYNEVQNLRISTTPDWEAISRWYWELCAPHLAMTNDALVVTAQGLVGATDGETMRSVYRWVSQNVRYMGLTMEDTSPGYAPHDVNVTFDNRYGVCRDKAALLVAMLRAAGVTAYPVLINAGSKMDREVPLPFFNHAIVAVANPDPAGEKYILMDPTDESSRDLMPSYLSDCSYLVARPEGETLLVTPAPAADLNAVRVETLGALEEDGSVIATVAIGFTGLNDNMYRGQLLRRKPEERRKFFERIVRSAAAGAELQSFELTPEDLQDVAEPLQAVLLVRYPETLLRGETREEFVLPFLSKRFGAANWLLEGSTSLEKRRFPLSLMSTAMTEETVELKLKGNVGKALALPDEVKMEGPYEFLRTYAVTDGVFRATRRLAVNAVEFPAEKYGELREDIKSVEAEERKRPVFAKDPDAKANVRNRLIRRTYDIASPTVWTITNTVVREILTYDGKKKSSELKYSFNPTWKNVEVVSAVVSNRDGRVTAVGPRETNLLDCDWAASAPRYPASKELIVSLPSVEIGSVISYTTVTTVSNAPAAYYGVRYRDTFEPTDLIVERFNDETEKSFKPRLVKFEPSQPDGWRWRKRKLDSYGDFRVAAKRLRAATEVGSADVALLGEELQGGVEGLKQIRDWMAKNVRLAGPSLYEVPLAEQLTDPAVVLKERYASRLDYIRTMCALLKGAGYLADIVFSSTDGDADWTERNADMKAWPNERAFSAALCRVTLKYGGFLGFGGRATDFFIGTENEYAPLGATIYAGSHYLDPVTAKFGVVTVPDLRLMPKEGRKIRISVRENGSADIEVVEHVWGPEVGAFRRQYAEMLPEIRSRHYQSLLGGLAQAATATSELFTEIKSYPTNLRYSAYVPHYAVVADGTITVTLPGLDEQLFPLSGSVRETPIAVGAADPYEVMVEVRFPEGYTVLEHAPEEFTINNPSGHGSEEWYSCRVRSGVDVAGGGGLAVAVTRMTYGRDETQLDSTYFEHLKALSRLAASRAARTVSVRHR